MFAIDTAGYFVQGILPNDNSIFFLPHREGKLKLIHNMSDNTQIDNIDGVWGTSRFAFYFLKDKKNDFFFRYDIKNNKVTLLEKYPPHSHYTYMYATKVSENDYLVSFEVETKTTKTDDILKLLRFKNGLLYEIEDYPLLQEVQYLKDKDLLILFYLNEGKRCMDIRSLNS